MGDLAGASEAAFPLRDDLLALGGSFADRPPQFGDLFVECRVLEAAELADDVRRHIGRGDRLRGDRGHEFVRIGRPRRERRQGVAFLRECEGRVLRQDRFRRIGTVERSESTQRGTAQVRVNDRGLK